MSRAAALRAVRTNHHDGFDPVAHLVVVSELEARPADRACRGVACLVEVRCDYERVGIRKTFSPR